MAGSNGEDHNLIAAEYVLGTLRGAARRHFARLIERDPQACADAEEWEQRLNLMAEAVPGIEPPDTLWPRILRAIEGGSAAQIVWRSAAFWRGVSAVATATAAALLVLLIQWQAPEPTAIPSEVAVLSDSEAKPGFLVRADFKSHAVSVEPLRVHHKPDAADYELWLVPKGTKPPESLGVIVVERKNLIALNDKQFEALKKAIAMAVSVEPLGGSPTGAPTGEVRFKGALVAAQK